MSRKPNPDHDPPQERPVAVAVHRPLLDAVRATLPQTRDWTNAQLVAACLALAIKGAA